MPDKKFSTQETNSITSEIELLNQSYKSKYKSDLLADLDFLTDSEELENFVPPSLIGKKELLFSANKNKSFFQLIINHSVLDGLNDKKYSQIVSQIEPSLKLVNSFLENKIQKGVFRTITVGIPLITACIYGVISAVIGGLPSAFALFTNPYVWMGIIAATVAVLVGHELYKYWNSEDVINSVIIKAFIKNFDPDNGVIDIQFESVRLNLCGYAPLPVRETPLKEPSYFKNDESERAMKILDILNNSY